MYRPANTIDTACGNDEDPDFDFVAGFGIETLIGAFN